MMRLRFTKIALYTLHLLFVGNVCATQISIVNLDGVNEGFNDNTVATPVGGNIGTTLGEQRLIVFQYVARIWQSIIDSDVEIKVEAQFDPLTCSAGSAVLGSAGATTVSRDFTNAPMSGTWYPIALASSLSGSDLSTLADIAATFNSEIDNNNNCLNNTNWYYGIDGKKPANSIDLLSVVMHEIGHGLGFLTFVNTASGAKLGRPARNDAFMLHLEDHSTGKTWDQMTDSERVASAIDSADLHWTGASVTSEVGNFTAGINQGHVRNYAPATLSQGSSVSHFDSALAPNELMEPFITQPKTGPGLAVELMADIGWNIFPAMSPIISSMADVSVQNGSSRQIAFVVGDNDTGLSTLTFSFGIANTSIIDQAGLSVTGSGVDRVLNIAPDTSLLGSGSVTVTVSDGVNSTAETFLLTVTNASPGLTIDSPANNADFTNTALVALQGTATDLEDGDISASLQWSSDIDGVLGAGSMLSTALSVGTHTITATVTDSSGSSASQNVVLNIIGDSDNDGMNDLLELQNFGDLTRDGLADFDSDGLSDIDELNIYGTLPTNPDSDGDLINDGDEVLNASNPLDELSWPNFADGDLAPLGTPDGLINAADYLIAQRIVLGEVIATSLELSHADLYPEGSADGVINTSDLILLLKLVQQQ
ncbi:MAG: hypothetical protein RQ982_03790 [Gammaproteobacteria bacterium]|nr:hypothetical protein [Gammaproteobacteria bacterium]